MAKKKKETPQEESPESSGLAVIEETAAEDPLAKFVQQRWREMAIVIAIVFAFIYGKNVFDSTRKAALQRSADILIQLQTSADEYLRLKELDELSAKEDVGAPTDENDSKEEEDPAAQRAKSRLQELVRTLSQERSPYKEISVFYTNWLNSIEPGDGSPAQLNEATGENQVLLSEVSQLVTVQGMIRSGVPEKKQKALAELQRLAEDATYVAVPALVLYARLNEQGSDADIKTVAMNLLDRQPEQRELLRRELPELF